jgi:predicted alpha/beta hydrolase
VFGWFRALSALFGYFPGDRVGFGGREARGVIRDWSRSGLRGRYEAAAEAALARVEAPVLAFHLAHDRFAPRRSLDHLLAKMPRAKAVLQPLVPADFASARADHFSWMRDPAPVADRIAAWIT